MLCEDSFSAIAPMEQHEEEAGKGRGLLAKLTGFALTHCILARSLLSWRPSLGMTKKLPWNPMVLPSLIKLTGQTRPHAPQMTTWRR
jgi:hypothetical protein